MRDRIRTNFARGLSISTITLGELRDGARHKGAEPADEERLDNFVRLLTLRDFDAEAADTYGRIAREIGVRRRSFDRLIAAHAVSLGLTLISRNGTDFSNVPGLKIENWSFPL